jgi:hypothetical protein
MVRGKSHPEPAIMDPRLARDREPYLAVKGAPPGMNDMIDKLQTISPRFNRSSHRITRFMNQKS